MQNLLKVKEELTVVFDKLNVALGGEEEKVAKDLLREESLKVLWKELREENIKGSKTGVEKQGS